MLPVKNRLKKKKDFQEVLKSGLTVRNKYFFLKVIERKENPFTRIGFVVSKKVSKKAVRRNRIKRLFRESLRLRMNKIRPGYDLVFIVLNSADGGTFLEIRKEIDMVLERNRLIILNT